VKWSGKEFRPHSSRATMATENPADFYESIESYIQMKPLLWFTVEGLKGTRGSQRDVVYLRLTNSAPVSSVHINAYASHGPELKGRDDIPLLLGDKT
jgi:hypothetical protein